MFVPVIPGKLIFSIPPLCLRVAKSTVTLHPTPPELQHTHEISQTFCGLNEYGLVIDRRFVSWVVVMLSCLQALVGQETLIS